MRSIHVAAAFLMTMASGCAGSEMEKELSAYVKGKDAEIGIAVIDCNGKMTTVNNDVQYPLMSVMKLHQAIAVSDSLEKSGIPLETEIEISAEELKADTYSPLRDRYSEAAGGSTDGFTLTAGGLKITIADLIRYTIQLSDNNACDILFRRFGGPARTDACIRGAGITDFAIRHNEEDMHRDLSLCYSNWSTPAAAASLIDKLLNGNILSPEYRGFIVRTMEGCTTGTDRLAAPLEGSEASIGHKTGTGDTNPQGRIIAINDIGFITLPDGRRYIIAVLVKDSALSPASTSRIIADISSIVFGHLS